MTSGMDIESRVRAFAEARLPALLTERVVLAASGGADSTAVVALLCESGIVDARRAVIAHFDHALRSAEASASDLRPVEALATRYALTIATERWAEPQPGEAAARDARYALLARVARDNGAAAVVTGHTSDDQAETALMHAMRGAGLHGLAGMSVDAPLLGTHAEARLWRPLLTISREETRAYCINRGLAFVDDSSNQDRAFARNRVRLDLLPAMERAQPGIRTDLVRLADAARATAAALDAVASSALPPAQADGAEIALSRDALCSLPGEALPHAFRLAIIGLLGDARDIERRHYNILARAVEAQTGSTFLLPRCLVVTVDAREIVLSNGMPRTTPIPEDFAQPVPFSGPAGDWTIDVRRSAEPVGVTIALPAGAIVRGRRPGDRLRPRGMRGHRKLQDYYVDRKIPRRLRDAAPVIALGIDVLWTPFGACQPAEGNSYRIEATRR